ncbi:MAG: type II toxin-antitoxin system RelE/ParE family toxin [Methylobacteriaceae bacterium]|nr:type II toxin-antitoxin system RelE/ParE family toxin [Methylobacteriaceae bacterium]
MRRLEYTAEARQDLEEIFEYLAIQMGGSDLARSFVERIEAQCSKLASLPGILGRPRPELRADLRSFPFGAYIVFFRYLEDKLEVVKIVHSHRDLDALFGEPSD